MLDRLPALPDRLAAWAAAAGDGPPLTPTADEARELLRRELADPAYGPGIVERVVDAVRSALDGLASGTSAPAPVLAAVVLATVVAAALALSRTVRRAGKAARGHGPTVPEGRPLTAADHRAGARRALAETRWDAALLGAFRAVAVTAAERGVVDGAPGRTASDVADALAAAHPDEAVAVRAAATAFNRVRYGLGHVDPEAAHAVVALDDRLLAGRAGRPSSASRPGAPPAPGSPVREGT